MRSLALASAKIRAWSNARSISPILTHSALLASDPTRGEVSFVSSVMNATLTICPRGSRSIALVPETYAALLRFADWIWQASLSALSSRGDAIPGATKLVNIARQGFSGHHYVIMALCSVVASFLVNAAFAFATKPGEALSPAQLAVAWKNNHDRRP